MPEFLWVVFSLMDIKGCYSSEGEHNNFRCYGKNDTITITNVGAHWKIQHCLKFTEENLSLLKYFLCQTLEHRHVQGVSLCSHQLIHSDDRDPDRDEWNHIPAQSQNSDWALDCSDGGLKGYKRPDQGHLYKKHNTQSNAIWHITWVIITLKPLCQKYLQEQLSWLSQLTEVIM